MHSNFNVFACTIKWLFCSTLSRYFSLQLSQRIVWRLLGKNPSVPHVPNWRVLYLFNCSSVFSDRETLELLAVSLSFEDFLPRLTFNCFGFICGTAPLVSIRGYRKCRRLSKPYFLSSGWISPPFQCVDCHTCPSVFQWNCPT